MLFLYAINTFFIWGGYFLLFHPLEIDCPPSVWFLLISSTILSALGWLFYYTALRTGQVSLVGTITSAYSLVTIISAWIFLHERLTIWQYQGIFLVSLSIIILSYSYSLSAGDNRGHTNPGYKGGWLFWSVLTCLAWGISVILSKLIINQIGYVNLVGFYAILTPVALLVVWWIQQGSLRGISGRGWFISELSQLFFCVGGICFFSSMTSGAVSLVAPLANIYPLVTLFIARIYLGEKLNYLQQTVIVLIVVGIVFIAL